MQLLHWSINNHALCMALLRVSSRFPPVEHGDGRINSAVQLLTVDAVNKTRAVSGCVSVLLQAFEFGNRVARDDVVGVEREHPGSVDSSFA